MMGVNLLHMIQELLLRFVPRGALMASDTYAVLCSVVLEEEFLFGKTSATRAAVFDASMTC